MNPKIKLSLFVLLSIVVTAFSVFFVMQEEVVMFSPKGIIALEERDLIILSTLLMLIVVLPVYALTGWIAWKYRASNKKAKYSPDWDMNVVAETIWWGVPCAIILALSIITWKSSHSLDPYKPLEMDKKPLTIQVVALQWKWLFVYPEQNIATVNYFRFPEKTPIEFDITAEAPMNSFWIPQLGGQIFAMPGMRTKLHLAADEVGSYRGSSANLSGAGFSSMHFTAEAVSEQDFASWTKSVQKSKNTLSMQSYNLLAKPSENLPQTSYRLTEKGLFDKILMKYMTYSPNSKGVDKDRLEGTSTHH